MEDKVTEHIRETCSKIQQHVFLRLPKCRRYTDWAQQYKSYKKRQDAGGGLFLRLPKGCLPTEWAHQAHKQIQKAYRHVRTHMNRYKSRSPSFHQEPPTSNPLQSCQHPALHRSRSRELQKLIYRDRIWRHRPPQGGTGCHRARSILAPALLKCMKNHEHLKSSVNIVDKSLKVMNIVGNL